MYCHFQVTDSTITLLRMFIGAGLGKGCNLCEREENAREAEGTGRWWDVFGLATESRKPFPSEELCSASRKHWAESTKQDELPGEPPRKKHRHRMLWVCIVIV